MAESHVVYPGDLAEDVEHAAEELELSVSAFYTEAARQKLQRESIEDEA